MQQRRRIRDESILESIAFLDRLSARVIAPTPSCSTCVHFTPDPINPPEGMGACIVGRGMWHARAPHACADHSPITEVTP